jgi:hypothetical protein
MGLEYYGLSQITVKVMFLMLKAARDLVPRSAMYYSRRRLMRKETSTSLITAAFSGAQSFVVGEKLHQAQIAIAVSLRDRLPNPPGEAMGYYALGL